ncbi:Anaphase-promoting complex cyclosome subunit 4 [Phytophthora infestans]|uniref:Anaphase-promoting complex subunit 4 n=1 Tax=Phytophthora infestans TaxID=4787 RepID=A0A833TFV2_PHYIN|nr:Anaphase-promoting complex cyclosome subunit 4 [Phytophthora infestans]
MPAKHAFVALQDRFVSSLVIACCPTMDLVAVLTLDHHLLVHRTTSWQKLLHVKPSDVGLEMVTLAWKPDGLQLAVGCDEGDVAIFEIESGEIIPERRSNLRHEICITAMHWAQLSEVGASVCTSNNKRRRHKRYGALGEHWNAPGLISQSKLQFQHRSTRFLRGFKEEGLVDDSVLLTGDERGFIALWWMGRVLLTRIDVSKHFTEEEFETMESMGYERGDTSGFRIERADLTPDFSLLFVLVVFSSKKSSHSVDNTIKVQEDTKVHRLLTLDMTTVQYIHEDVTLVANTIDRAHEILDRIATTGRQMTTEWKNATRIFELKMGLIGSLYEKYACEDPPQVDMLSVVVTGITAPALAQYFAQDIEEMSVHRMQKALFSGCDTLRALVDEKLKPDLVSFLFLVSELRGHVKWNPQTYSKTMGITVAVLDELVKTTQDTLVAMETLTLALHETRQDFSLFFQWILERIRIHSNSSRSEGAIGRDAGDAKGTKSLLNLRRLCDFLQHAAEVAKQFKKQQPGHNIYRVETTFGNPVSHQLTMGPGLLNESSKNQSEGCLDLIKSLQERWTAILDAVGGTLAQSIGRKESGCFTVGDSVEECHVRFRQLVNTKRSEDIDAIGVQSEDEDSDEAVDWDALKHFGSVQDGPANCSMILIGFRLQSGVLRLLRTCQDTDSTQLRRDHTSRLHWEAATVNFSHESSSSPLICQGFDFYGDMSTNKVEQLAFVLGRAGEGQVHQEWLYLQQYDRIEFTKLNPSTSFEAAVADPIHTFRLDQLRGRVIASLPTANHASKNATSVIATASRGVLCVVIPPSRLSVYDAEDSEDEEDGDDDDDDD